MSKPVTNYQCPSCTAPLHFSASTGRLECDFCGQSYTVEEMDALYAPSDSAAAPQEPTEAEQSCAAAQLGRDWDDTHMRLYSCPSCGAQLICEETTAATSCPYCNNPSVIPGSFRGILRPDFVLPFKLEKKEAVAALKKHYRGKRLLPKAFTRDNHIEEVKGVYVPFWLFDGETSARISYSASNSSSYRSGDYQITETKHYDVLRAGTVRFEKVPVDGSEKMPDAYMDSIEPFDYSALVPFSPAYLPGYLAEKYDVDAEDARDKAEDRCAGSAEELLRQTVTGYDSVETESRDIRVRQDHPRYALLPVWMLTTRWKDQNYLFAMNGQTGTMVGDLPADKGRLRAWFWGTFVTATALFSLFLSGPVGRAIVELLD